MMHAYDEMYLEKARIALGRMFDFVVYQLGYSIEKFFDLFISSGVSRRFENGDVDLLVGKSGVEIGYEVFVGCESLESLTLPTSINKIGQQHLHTDYITSIYIKSLNP